MLEFELPEFLGAQVIVAGDVMLDKYMHGTTSRISPEAPVPIVKINEISNLPGGGANVALNIAALGAGVKVFGFIGSDQEGRELNNILLKSGVDTDFCITPDMPTTVKIRVVSQHQQLIRMDMEETLDVQPHLSNLYAILEKSLDANRVLVLSDYGKGALARCEDFIKIAADNNCPVLIDPKGRNFERYHGASLLTPNLKEFEDVVGSCIDTTVLCERAENLLTELNLKALLVTRGEQGMSLFERGNPPVHLGAETKEVYDVTGAGDTVIGVMAAAIAAKSSLTVAAKIANIAAGITVGKLGAATASVEEINRKLRKSDKFPKSMVSFELEPVQNKLLSLEMLKEKVDHCKAIGEKIVFTNGCFDILHVGHVKSLQQARTLGHRLVVAINDDDSIKRLKGESRPVNPLTAREQVLAALSCVDWVIPFSEDTPRKIIQTLVPDVLVKGGDWTPDQIVGSDIVKANGGIVKIIPLEEGYSTTNIVTQINNL